MKDVSRRPIKGSAKALLYDGKRMTQAEFHRAYDRMPENYRAELLAGIVREPSPLGWAHGESDVRLGFILDLYSIRTPGLEVGGNTTVILSNDDEVQPDLVLLIPPALGGQTHTVELPRRKAQSPIPYIKGPPELVAEIADSSLDIDLGVKKDRYAAGGVLEYIVLCVRPKQIYWFDLKTGRRFEADSNSVLRSEVFPGLWIHSQALLNFDGEQSMRTLDQGLASSEHQEFVVKLKAARYSHNP